MSIQNEADTIFLGGETYHIKAFTLDELQRVAPALKAYYDALSDGVSVLSAEFLDPACKVIAAALNLPTDEIRAELGEIGTAIDAIADISGLTRLGERLGATTADTATSSTSTASTPIS